MIKFWKFKARKRIIELEETFISWSNSLDFTLREFSNTSKFSDRELYSQQEHITGSLSEVRDLGREYSSYFLFQKRTHPNYEKLLQRLETLKGKLIAEMDIRKKSC